MGSSIHSYINIESYRDNEFLSEQLTEAFSEANEQTVVKQSRGPSAIRFDSWGTGMSLMRSSTSTYHSDRCGYFHGWA